MKRILVDGRFIGVGSSITIYTLEILSRILELDKENQYTLLIRPQGTQKLADFPIFESAKNLKVEILDIPHYSLAEQTKLLSYLNHTKYDLVHFTQFNHPIFYKGKYVVTIHDLTQFTEFFQTNPLKHLAFKKVMQSAVKDSAKIISVSETTKKDIVKRFAVKSDKIDVTYLGYDEKYNQTSRQVSSPRLGAQAGQESAVSDFKEKFNITGQYFLYAGMWKKHKNLKRLLQAFEKFLIDRHPERQRRISGDSSALPQNDNIQLVLMGNVDPDEPEIMAEIDRINSEAMKQYNNKAIIVTGFLPEKSEEQVAGFAGALAYIIPSLYEGFGLPPLQAMACGTPVLSSTVSCMPEILGDAPLYFDPYNIDDIANAMTKITGDEKLQKELSEKGIKQAKKYDWNITAEKTLAIYKELLARP